MVYTHPTVIADKNVLQQLVNYHIPKKKTKEPYWWKLHHYNARPHVANAVIEFLVQKHISTVHHPPYNPDLAPCSFFFLTWRPKRILKNVDLTTRSRQRKLSKRLWMSRNGFLRVFQKWQKWSGISILRKKNTIWVIFTINRCMTNSATLYWTSFV